MKNVPAGALTRAALARGLRHLAAADGDLARVLKEHGRPPLWERDEGFGTLVLIILEQQVSLASARAAMGDDEARAALMRVKGVGAWTAEIYLLRTLLRRDAWPAGDLALAVAAQEVKRLPSRPAPGELEELAHAW